VLKIHTRDGRTVRVDLRDEIQAKRLMRQLDQEEFQATISGITVVETHSVKIRCKNCEEKVTRDIGVQATLSRPAMSDIRFEPYLIDRSGGGTGVDMFVSDYRVTLTTHERHRASSVGMQRVGRRLFAPRLSGGQ